MAMTSGNNPTTVQSSGNSAGGYGPALAVLTTLFFIWGSLTSMNDVLIPFVQNVLHKAIDVSMLIQTAFFSAYFVFSIPSAKIIDWIGYKRAIIVGLGTMVAACLLFYPAARIPSFPFFLTALVVLAAGITVLQVAANPYVAVLGRPETASSRLNLTQAFNSLGTAVFPLVGAWLILGKSVEGASPAASQNGVIKLYVYFFAVLLVLLAFLFAVFRLPKMEQAEHKIGQKVDDSIWKHPNLVYGAIAIFVYVGAEVAIGSDIANYLALPNIGHFASNVADPAVRYHAALAIAAQFISLYWLGAMLGRFIGSAVLGGVKALYLGLSFLAAGVVLALSYIAAGSTGAGFISEVLAFLHQLRPLIDLCTIVLALFLLTALFNHGRVAMKTSHMLALCASCAGLLVLISVSTEGHLAMWSILLIGFFNSIMFPSIFTSGIAELGPLTGDGSGLLNMAIVGGAAIPLIVGRLAVAINHRYYPSMTQGETSWGQGIHYALVIAAICYLYILFYAVSGSKPNSERYGHAGARG